MGMTIIGIMAIIIASIIPVQMGSSFCTIVIRAIVIGRLCLIAGIVCIVMMAAVGKCNSTIHRQQRYRCQRNGNVFEEPEYQAEDSDSGCCVRAFDACIGNCKF